MESEHTELRETDGIQDTNLASLRLDTNPLLTQVEAHLRSAKPFAAQDEYGNLQIKYETVGEPLANELGINVIMSICRMHINSQTVQGNFKNDEFWEASADFLESFSESIVTNRHIWGIKVSNCKTIIDNVSSVVEKFHSRTIGNLERESYNRSTFQQTNTTKARSLFKRREAYE